MVAVAEPVPWPVTAVEHRGGTVLRISHKDTTVADHDLAYLIGRAGLFSGFTGETIATAQLIDRTVGLTIDGETVDLAPDAIWDHAHGRCGGGGCTGWTLEQTAVVALPTDAVAVAGLIVEAWSRIASDTSDRDDDAPWLHDPGGRDWLQVRLVEWHRADSGAAVVHLLQQSLPLPVAGLCVRDIIRACNEAYAPIAGWIATETVAGGHDDEDLAAAVADAEPALRAAVARAIERAVARG